MGSHQRIRRAGLIFMEDLYCSQLLEGCGITFQGPSCRSCLYTVYGLHQVVIIEKENFGLFITSCPLFKLLLFSCQSVVNSETVQRLRCASRCLCCRAASPRLWAAWPGISAPPRTAPWSWRPPPGPSDSPCLGSCATTASASKWPKTTAQISDTSVLRERYRRSRSAPTCLSPRPTPGGTHWRRVTRTCWTPVLKRRYRVI